MPSPLSARRRWLNRSVTITEPAGAATEQTGRPAGNLSSRIRRFLDRAPDPLIKSLLRVISGPSARSSRMSDLGQKATFGTPRRNVRL